MYCCQLITTVTGLLCVLQVQGLGHSVSEEIDMCINITVTEGARNHGSIRLQNCSGNVSFSLTDIPGGSWFGIFLEEFVRVDIDTMKFDDHTITNLDAVDQNSGNKMESLVYRASPPDMYNISIEIEPKNGRNVSLTLEFIVARVMSEANDISGSTNVNESSGFLVSHETFNGSTYYPAGVNKTLNIRGLPMALQITYFYFDVLGYWSSWWWRWKWKCDDYFRIVGKTTTNYCGGRISRGSFTTLTRNRGVVLTFVTTDNLWDKGQATGFLIYFNGTSDGCPPKVENANTTMLAGDKYNIECNNGYELDDGNKSAVLNCSQPGKCRAIMCQRPQEWNGTLVEVNSSVQTGEGPSVGYILNFRCNDSRYELHPNTSESECQANKSWSIPQFPECRLILTSEILTSTTDTPFTSQVSTAGESTTKESELLGTTSAKKEGNKDASKNEEIPEPNSPDQSTLIGSVVGGAVLLVLLVVIAVIVIMYRKRNSRQRKDESDDGELHGMNTGDSATDNGVYFSPPSPEGAANQTKTVDENVYHLANDEAVDNYENAAEIQRTNEAADMADNYTDVLAANKKPRFTAAQELIDNDLYSS